MKLWCALSALPGCASVSSPLNWQYSSIYFGRLKTPLRLITSRSFVHLSVIMVLAYWKKSAPMHRLLSATVPMIFAARCWDSLDTPIEFSSTYLVIFIAMSLSFTTAHLERKKEKKKTKHKQVSERVSIYFSWPQAMSLEGDDSNLTLTLFEIPHVPYFWKTWRA